MCFARARAYYRQSPFLAARSWAVKAVVFGLPPGGGAGSIPAAGISGVAPRAGSLPRSWLPGRVYGIPCARQRRPRRFPDLLRTVRQGFSDREQEEVVFPPMVFPSSSCRGDQDTCRNKKG